MRTLLLMRGAPGCGKSTWIKNNNLSQYTLCADDIRVLCTSTQLQPDGSYKISQDRDTEQYTWNTLMNLLEFRMSRGEFTVVDSTCSKTKDITKYRDLASKYRYRMFIVDFTDVPLETCLAQNKQRPEWKQVPNAAIENIYARFATQQIPSQVTIIKPDELHKVYEQPINLSEYKKLVFIGDIHGCYDTLMQYSDFKNGLNPETEYIFCGDYVDRGNQNSEVLKFLYSIKDLPNVCLLEGNHERSLYEYGNDEEFHSKTFRYKTAPALTNGGFTKEMARALYRKLRQCSHIIYNDFEILACHAGIPNVAQNLVFLPTHDLIHGTGKYEDCATVESTWMAQTNENAYLVHGHRNIEKDDIQSSDRTFNLEGQVEFGGEIRIAELEGGKWNTIALPDCQPINRSLSTEHRKIETIHDTIEYLRNNKFIQEKELGDGISSFNFTREAFYNKNWTEQTILARGLFLDTKNEQIMARSYEKFFKINEVHATELGMLKENFEFPVQVFKKENGYLAIVSYDYIHDDLFIASKSTTGGDYASWIKEILHQKYDYCSLLSYLRSQYRSGFSQSIVFECIDPVRDPHIIKYSESALIMLDIIYNQLNFEKAPLDQVRKVAELIKCPVKELVTALPDWESFKKFYEAAQEEDYKYNGEYIEGFVFEDHLGFMTKLKTSFYNEWKKLRGVAAETLKSGYIRKTSMLSNKMENLFYGFCKELYKDRNAETKQYPYNTDIISLRESFLKSVK